MTGKSFSPKDKFSTFHKYRKLFDDLAGANAWLKENYGKSKRAPMYVDTPLGTKRIGYVIGFRTADWSHAPVHHWIQQDWIEFRDCKPLELDSPELRREQVNGQE